MKKLYIIRHGKSSWEDNVRDHDRTLKERGINDAHLIGSHLKELKIKPDAIWSSTAARALQTATIVTEYLDYKLSSLKLKRDLYTFNSSDLLKVINNCEDDVYHFMLFSHNNGITDLVNMIGDTRFDNVPTTGVVCITFNQDSWSTIMNGKTQFHLFPKDLK